MKEGGITRETREGWPLLMLKLRQMGTQRVQMKVLTWCFLCWFVMLFMQVQETSFFPHRTHQLICPYIAQQAEQAVVPCRLSLNMCL